MARRLHTIHTDMKPLQNRDYYFKVIDRRSMHAAYRLVFQKNTKNK